MSRRRQASTSAAFAAVLICAGCSPYGEPVRWERDEFVPGVPAVVWPVGVPDMSDEWVAALHAADAARQAAVNAHDFSAPGLRDLFDDQQLTRIAINARWWAAQDDNTRIDSGYYYPPGPTPMKPLSVDITGDAATVTMCEVSKWSAKSTTRFAAVTAVPQNVPFDQFHDQQSLANASFMLMSQIPSDTLAFLASSGNFHRTVEYWYGEHPWAGGEIPWTIDGFGGPAALMSAIISDPTLRAHGASDPSWANALRFLSQAVNALGRHSGLDAECVSTSATADLASALVVVIPEITALLDPRNASSQSQPPVHILFGSNMILALGLDVEKGPLNRVLGLSLMNDAARDSFAAAMASYLNDATAQPASRRIDAIVGAGHLYGLASGAIAGEASRIASTASAAAQATRDMYKTILAWIPMPGTGVPVVDYLIQLGGAMATDSITDRIYEIKAPDEIQDASVAEREGARAELGTIALEYFKSNGLDETTAAELVEKLTSAFDIDSNASSNPGGSGEYATN